MVVMSFSMTGLCSSSLPCLREKGLDVFRSIDGKRESVLHTSVATKGVLFGSW